MNISKPSQPLTRKPIVIRVVVMLCLSFYFGATFGVISAQAQTKHYVCAPCGLPCDNTVYDKPGICPSCGMTLVDQEAAKAAAHAHKKAAILIFNGVQIIDYTGPYEVLGAADFDVYTVAATKEPVTTAMGMTVVPKYTFANAPQPDVLVVPGGGVKIAQENAATLNWIKDVTAHAEHTMSVCNGAFILASAGLLDGLTATTTYSNIDKLRETYPKIKVVSDQRFVDNGKIITTAGLSAGIDGALHVVAKMNGDGFAQRVALGEEYDWRPHGGFARGALADRLIPDLDLKTDLDASDKWDIHSTQGGTDHWEIVFRGDSKLSAAQVLDRIGQALASKGKWTSVKAATSSSSSLMSQWKFSDHNGKAWTGTLTIQATSSDQYTVKLAIARVS